MLEKQFYATYFLYNSIFVEQNLDLDHFGHDEKSAILNIAVVSFLVIDAFKLNDQDVINTQKYIKDNMPKPLITVCLDTLQDIIALDNNIHEYLVKEFSCFVDLGEYYYKKVKAFFPNQKHDPTNGDDLFSLTMFCVEAMLLLDQCNYDLSEAKTLIVGHEYEQEISDVFQNIQE